MVAVFRRSEQHNNKYETIEMLFWPSCNISTGTGSEGLNMFCRYNDGEMP